MKIFLFSLKYLPKTTNCAFNPQLGSKPNLAVTVDHLSSTASHARVLEMLHDRQFPTISRVSNKVCVCVWCVCVLSPSTVSCPVCIYDPSLRTERLHCLASSSSSSSGGGGGGGSSSGGGAERSGAPIGAQGSGFTVTLVCGTRATAARRPPERTDERGRRHHFF